MGWIPSDLDKGSEAKGGWKEEWGKSSVSCQTHKGIIHLGASCSKRLVHLSLSLKQLSKQPFIAQKRTFWLLDLRPTELPGKVEGNCRIDSASLLVWPIITPSNQEESWGHEKHPSKVTDSQELSSLEAQLSVRRTTHGGLRVTSGNVFWKSCKSSYMGRARSEEVGGTQPFLIT